MWSAAVVVTHLESAVPWSRTMERILGTLGGGLAAAALAAVLVPPWEHVAIMFPLAAAAIALRSVNYTLFVLFMTPLFVLATTLFGDGGGEAASAARVADNLLGSAVALVGCLMLSRNWRHLPQRFKID